MFYFLMKRALWIKKTRGTLLMWECLLALYMAWCSVQGWAQSSSSLNTSCVFGKSVCLIKSIFLSPHLYVESKIWNKWTYLQQEQNHRQRTDLWCLEVDRSGMAWELGIGRYKLLHVKLINNKVLLYSTGNYIQNVMINHNGKECEKESIRMYNSIILLYSRN